MHAVAEILLLLFVVFVSAQVGAEVAQRLRMPAVVGEIAAGCIVGPSVLGWVKINNELEVLAEIGAVMLLFAVGLETRLSDLTRVGRSAAMVGVLGVVAPFVLGVWWAIANDYPTGKALFIAAAFVATSAGITARLLQDAGVLDRIESRVILGAAVIDDILAMLLLGVVVSFFASGGFSFGNMALVLLQAVGFIALTVEVGGRLMRRSSAMLEAPINPHSPLTICLAICLGLAAAAAHIGLAAIIGAFLAGMIAAESQQRHTLEKQLQAILALVVPFFFVVTGAKADLSLLADRSVLMSLLVVTLLAILSKLLACGLGAWSLGKKSALIVGLGMVPRGEVGIIIASLGLLAGAFDSKMYAIIVAMSLITSIVAPPLLLRLLGRGEIKA